MMEFMQFGNLNICWEQKIVIVSPKVFRENMDGQTIVIEQNIFYPDGYTATALMPDGTQIKAMFEEKVAKELFPNMFPEERKVS